MKRLCQAIVTLFCPPILLLSLVSFETANAVEGSALTIAQADGGAQYYWDQAQATDGEARDANLLLSANSLLKSGKVDQAKDVLKGLSRNIEGPQLTNFKRLVDARMSLAMGSPDTALNRLNQIDTQVFAAPVLIEYYDLKAQALEASGDLMKSVAMRVELDAHLSSKDQYQTNNYLIWDTLQHVSPAALNAAMDTDNSVLKGWVDLARIERKLTGSDASYADQLQTWREQYRGHPGSERVPSNVAKTAVNNLTPQHIALLLPIDGKLAASGAAVRDGFMAAYYLDYQSNPQSKVKVTVYDTKDDTQVKEAYDRAVTEGADMIVGPLTKPGVEQISHIASRDMRVLALNYMQGRSPSNVYEFGLSPEDEAKQAALRAWEDGQVTALILAQEGEWGKRVTEAFTREWRDLGGQVLETRTFKPGDQLSDPVKKLLKVDDSEVRAKKLAQDINTQVSSDGRRRQDVDMIFLAGMPGDARQIQPLLSFYYAHDVPVYATSSVYSGVPNPSSDKDLNGMTICDITWITDAKPTTLDSQQPALALWPNATQSQLRLYGLGVDAYEIIPLIPRLQTLPEFSMPGATGKLSMTDNEINRTLRCTQFVDGQPKRLPSSI